MTLLNALIACRQGKKITCEEWQSNGCYIVSIDGILTYYCGLMKRHEPVELSNLVCWMIQDRENANWEVM